MTAEPPGDPALLDVRAAAAQLRASRLSARELVDACLRRIAADTTVDAFVRVFEERARATADAADARRARDGANAPPLLGVPVGVKDVFDVAGAPTTAGSRLLAGIAPARATATAAARLERAGMLLIGHTRTWEFAFGAPPEAVGNPWDARRSAAGSSAGSAAAVVARMVPAAIGTDTGGSLRGPSAYCGASTIKPTLGRVPLDGTIPCAASFDHAGPIARTLLDCAPLLAAMAGDAGGESWAPRSGATPLAGVRVVRSPRADDREIGVTDEVLEALERVSVTLLRLGASVDRIETPAFDLSGFWPLVQADALAYHRRLGHWPSARERYTARMRDLLERAEAASLDALGRARWEAARRTVAREWSRWFAAERVDVLIEPTMPETAIERVAGPVAPAATRSGGNLTAMWNHVGFPVVTLPAGCGRASGLPTSISLIAPPRADDALVHISIDLQERLGVPRPPGLER